MSSDDEGVQTQPYQNIKKTLKYDQEDSGFKAWENDSVFVQNSTNLLRNFKSQLLTYEEKYKKLDTNKTVPIKLPALEYMKNTKYRPIKNNKTIQIQEDTVLTQRRALQVSQTENLYKHKSIEMKKKRPTSKQPGRAAYKRTNSKQNHTIDQAQERNQPVLITKVQQMKFSQNQKRVRKRDLYLAIFGQRGKGKVQKIEFDDQNKAYQFYLQKKNQQMKVSNPAAIESELQRKQLRCSTQLNGRGMLVRKPQITGQSMNILSKNTSHLPMRY